MPIIARALPEKNQTFYCAISGGVDSLAGTFYLLRKGFKVKCFHFNHSHSPDNALMQKSVEMFCEDFGVELTVASPPKDFKIEDGESIEAALRGVRVKAYNELDAPICVFHHLGDVKEGMLMRMMSGNPEYSAIPAKTRLKNGQHLFRPFLLTEKTDFEKFVFNNNLTKYLCEDKSNENCRYMRNFLRNQVIPLIETRVKLNNAAKKNALKAYEKIKEIQND